ncbi:ester cyclase [Sorangium sp. So ce388]|uniref:ester cyclase n=1 Tax=Sorangium sp. So ce388 TaxID=3133309 RepID=UPI003F5C4F0A
MRKPVLISALSLSLFAAASACYTQGAGAEDLPEPRSMVVDASLSKAQADAEILAARRFYAFWSTGDASYLDAAIAPSFTDRTLPAGRPQGPAGPAFASKGFRAAVPDLTCEVEQLIVAGDRVVAHLRFRGHFTGTFGDRKGAGQPVDFIATDILRVQEGRITDNWHIEDNLTLFQQLGVVAQ